MNQNTDNLSWMQLKAKVLMLIILDYFYYKS